MNFKNWTDEELLAAHNSGIRYDSNYAKAIRDEMAVRHIAMMNARDI